MSSLSLSDSFASLYNPPDWRSEVRDSDREEMVQPIMNVLNDILEGFSEMSVDEAFQVFVGTESKLFLSAFSVEEYQDVATLNRRLHAIAHLQRNMDVTESVENESTNSVAAVVPQPLKRQRVEQAEFLLNNQLGVIKHIYSFIDGLETFRHIRINRFTAHNLTQCIERIDISCNILRAPGHPKDLLLKILQATPQLRVLQIAEETSSAVQNESPTSAMSGNALAIKHLAQALDQGMAKELRFLSICLDNTFASLSSDQNEEDGAHDLIEALSKGHHSKLVYLQCRQFLSPMSVLRLAEAIAQGKLPSLKGLDLCGNGIGEQLARALWLTLASTSANLRVLILHGNILTDRDAKRLAKTLEESTGIPPLLLGIKDNFIGDEGRQALENVSGVQLITE